MLVTGSHYVLGPARAALAQLRLCDRSLCVTFGHGQRAGSELLSMMALVAAVVAAVILVFFGIGYLFGRLFL